MDLYTKSFLLLFTLLNPFLLSIYLLDLIHELETGVFARILARGVFIAGLAFVFFAWTGDAARLKSFGTIQHLGEVMYTQWLFPFEAVSLLLLVAILGAVVVAKPRI